MSGKSLKKPRHKIILKKNLQNPWQNFSFGNRAKVTLPFDSKQHVIPSPQNLSAIFCLS
jgi:hypothetical protein